MYLLVSGHGVLEFGLQIDEARLLLVLCVLDVLQLLTQAVYERLLLLNLVTTLVEKPATKAIQVYILFIVLGMKIASQIYTL